MSRRHVASASPPNRISSTYMQTSPGYARAFLPLRAQLFHSRAARISQLYCAHGMVSGIDPRANGRKNWDGSRQSSIESTGAFLSDLQSNGRMTNVELAERGRHIRAPPLPAAGLRGPGGAPGIIKGLPTPTSAPRRWAYSVSVFALVGLKQPGRDRPQGRSRR